VPQVITRYAQDGTGEIYAETQSWRPAESWETGTALPGVDGLWALVAVAGTIPPDAHEISADEYTAVVSERRAQADTAAQNAAQADQLAAQESYNELTRVGVSPGVAERLTGYTPPGEV
jgi:hypothetical protein